MTSTVTMAQNQTFTLRSPPYSYLHLSLVPSGGLAKSLSDETLLDSVTVYSYLNSALARFLGVHGSAISFDILKESGRDVWVRIPSEDASALVAALAQWSNSKGEMLRVIGRSAWLGAINDDGVERDRLFSMER